MRTEHLTIETDAPPTRGVSELININIWLPMTTKPVKAVDVNMLRWKPAGSKINHSNIA